MYGKTVKNGEGLFYGALLEPVAFCGIAFSFSPTSEPTFSQLG